MGQELPEAKGKTEGGKMGDERCPGGVKVEALDVCWRAGA